MPDKTIYLHVGHYKTGTSAIQAFLSDNAENLARCGYLYPTSGRPRSAPTNHAHLSLSLARDYGFTPPAWYGASLSSGEVYSQLHTEIANSSLNKIIISSEEFLQLALRNNHLEALSALRAQLRGYDVNVLLYIREPLSLLKSWYNEVNKGPNATANFPTFAKMVKPDFLSQKAIADRFAEVFGADKLHVMTYRRVGNAHLDAFMKTVGCEDMPFGPERPLVQEAQPLEVLEARRTAKALKKEQTAPTLTRIHNPSNYRSLFEMISTTYNELVSRADHPVPSQLSAVTIMEHYADLVRALPPDLRENQEADRMRDLALAIEKEDIPFAHAMMSIAAVIRPKGRKIKDKLSEYSAKLGLEASAATVE